MSTYTLSLHPKAVEDIKKLKKYDKNSFKKLEKLLAELQLHPNSGTGKPEKLKYQEGDVYSRRISQKHRLVYRVNNQKISVWVLAAHGHYEDK